MEADGNGYGAITAHRAGGSSLGPPPREQRRERYNLDSTTAVDRRSDNWATRTAADFSVPRLAGVFLIT